LAERKALKFRASEWFGDFGGLGVGMHGQERGESWSSPKKGGGWGVFAGNSSYVVYLAWVDRWLPGVFCALLCTFVALFGASARGASRTIFRMLSSMEFALRTVSSILRFWGRMAGRFGAVIWLFMWFVLLGF
jgi:hypothetical protein